MFTKAMTIAGFDDDLSRAMEGERQRREDHIELIASENHVSAAVMQAQGSVFTNKYAEGYPGKRYYGGCENMDGVEELARQRIKKLFGCDHANVQPHSGSQANAAVYLAVLKPGDTILSLDLAHGGHLSHGLKANISGLLYNIVSYGRPSKDRAVRLRGNPPPGPRAQAQAHHLRGVGLSANHRL